MKDLAEDVSHYGYYGGVRLVKATIKRFFDYCCEQKIDLDTRNFTIRYHSSIPLHLGLAGSSAIITACIRALMNYYSVSIPDHILPNLVLSVERQELGIGGGLQDRVAQSYQGIVYMDFDRELMERRGYGEYEQLNPERMPNLFIAYKPELSEGSEVVHNDLRYRFDAGEKRVVEAMMQFGEYARQVRDMFISGYYSDLGRIMNENFDLRRSICAISRENEAMVEAARSVGASAKFTGSGGAIIGTYDDEAQFELVKGALEKTGAITIQPEIQ